MGDDEGNIVDDDDVVYEDEEYIDEFGNVRKVLKEVEEEGIKRAPKTRDLKERIITDKYGNKKKVLVDDEGNVVDDDDIEYEDEEYIDEFGNKRTRKVAKIKEDVMKKMQEKEKEDQERFYSKPATRKVLKEIEEIDEFGNVRKVLKEV